MNIILYPRVYNKRGAENSHSVLGVTHDGELVNVKLRLDKVTENSPSIKEFSRDDRKAKQACTATKDNAKDSREGVLLFTRCFLDEKDYNNNETNYVAKWATVLCEDKDSNEPIIGFGRLVIPKDFELYKSLAEKLQTALEQEDDDEVDAIKTEMAKYSSFSFPGVIYSHDKIRTFISSEVEEARKYVKQTIHETFQSGMVGGFAIRLLTKDYKVIPNSYLEVFQKYNPKTKEYITAKQTADMYFESDHAKTAFKSNEFLIDIIPLKRMNSGKFTTKHYSSKNVYPMVKSLYSTIKGNIKICKVVAKTYNFVNPQNFDETKVLLDRMHSLSEPLGHPMRLSKDGTMSLLLRGETSDSLNTDTEKFYWVGNDSSRVSMSRNQRILYLLDKGYMPTSSKGRVSDTVQLIENDSYLSQMDEEHNSSELHQNPVDINKKPQEMEREYDPEPVEQIDTNSEQSNLVQVIDGDTESVGNDHQTEQADNEVAGESSLNNELEQNVCSQESTSQSAIIEDNNTVESTEEVHKSNFKEELEKVELDSDRNSDVFESNDTHNEELTHTESHEEELLSNDDDEISHPIVEIDEDNGESEFAIDEIVDTKAQDDFGSLVELEDSLSTTNTQVQEDTTPEKMVDITSEKEVQDQDESENIALQEQEPIEEDETDQEDTQDDYSSQFMESIEQIKQGKKPALAKDEQDPADILARWTNGSEDKNVVEPNPLQDEPKEKPQQDEASEEEGLTGMAAFMKNYLE
ncbi:hypothetical protein [Vibrio parahaemolyticus]|uniref:hypothetical protein n=1 Tax=Vibrio parahaemolyticus TaxID=670 RepID=UPI0006BF7777|nr:hypothetical protein ACX10_06415 [Vibrio parahaemolyticus]